MNDTVLTINGKRWKVIRFEEDGDVGMLILETVKE